MASTKRPETWWLYSDHARSASVRGAFRTGGIASSGGDVRRGQRGVNCVRTSAEVARSASATSAAGGSEVSAAATKSTVTATPSSTSTVRRSPRGGGAPSPRRRTAARLKAASASSPARTTTFVRTMTP